MAAHPRRRTSYQALMALLRLAGALGKTADGFLRRYQLTQAQFNVLIVLEHELPRGATQTELCRALLVKGANMTALVRRLEDRGLISRAGHPEDERAWWVRITAAGRRLLREVEPDYYRLVEELMKDHSLAELRSFVAHIERTRVSLEKLQAKLQAKVGASIGAAS